MKYTASIMIIIFCSVLLTDLQLSGQSMFRGDEQHTGYYNSPDLKTFKVEKWRFETHGKVFSSPAIDNSTLFIGSGDSCLYAIDIATGMQLWKFKTGGAVHSSPAISNDMIFFESYDGFFYALNSSDGELKWKFQTNGEKHFAMNGIYGWLPSTLMMEDIFDYYLSSPVTNDSLVYFGCGDGNIYALNKFNGTQKWRFTTNGVVHSSPALKDGKLICGSWDRFMYCLDAKTGTELWRFGTGADASGMMTGIISSPSIVDSVAFFGCKDAKFYAVNIKNGKKIWSIDNGGAWIISSAAVADSVVYFGTSDNTMVRAVNIKNGKELFRINSKSYVYSSPAITKNVIYYGSFTGWLNAVDRTTGKELWNYQTDASKTNSGAILVNERIDWQKTAGSKSLYNYDVNVECMNKFMTLGCILSSPIILNGIIYFGSADGNVYALEGGTQTDVKKDEPHLGESFLLEQNYPNPFNPATTIKYLLPKEGLVKLKVFDILGREVATLVNEKKDAGYYHVDFDASMLVSGIYIYSIQVNGFNKSQKMMLVK